jgi:hypothetical protein
MRTRLKTYFPGEFNPPTKYDLDIAKWLSRKTLDVSEVIIVIGKDKEGELSQADKAGVWELYLGDNVSAPISIVKSQNLSPLSYIYKQQENAPEEAFAIALDQETADDERFQSHFDMFSNHEVIITPSHEKQDLTSLAKEGDFKKFSSALPSSLPKEDKQKVFNLVKGPEKDPVDEVFTVNYWKNNLGNLLEKAGIK